MQVVVLLLLVAGLALLVLGLITASTPLVLGSAAASLLAGYAISRYRRRQEAAPAAATSGAAAEAPVAARTSSAVTVAELAQAVAAERAATSGEPASASAAPAHAGPGVATELAVRTDSAVTAAPAHAAVGQPADRPAFPASVGEPTDRPASPASVGERAAPGDTTDFAEDEEADPPVAETDPPLRSRGAEPVWVIDGRPRYHLPGCDFLLDRGSEPVPLRQAVEDGFTPCGLCDPDTVLAAG